MRSLLLFVLICCSATACFSQTKVNLESTNDIQNWVTTHKFKTDENFGYSLEVEFMNQHQILVFSHNSGSRKEFTNLAYTSGATSAMVIAQGEGNNSIDVMVLENGDLMLAGMVFKAEE